MKILIADDEALVRAGLKNSIAWEKLGISTVLLAEDGVQALRLAQQERPDIVLTDVRMPKMDGIQLTSHLRQVLPGVHVIFMSGYSDKAYLKAAIHLRAISYVEKPIDCQEVEEAVAEAISLAKEYTSNQDARSLRSRAEKARLAMDLADSDDQDEAQLRRRWKELDLPPAAKLCFSTVLIRLTGAQDVEDLPGLSEFLARLHDQAQARQLAFLYAIQNDRILIHLYTAAELTREKITWFCRRLQEYLSPFCQFFLAAGAPAQGLHHIHRSYRSARETLRGGFYGELNAVHLWSEEKAPPVSIDLKGCLADFRAALAGSAYEQARQGENELYEAVCRQRQLSADVVRSTYYQMASIMEWAAAKNCIAFSATVQERPPWQIVASSRTVSELHSYLTFLLDAYIQQATREKDRNTAVYLMKEYIRSNFNRDMLSVREIAEAACLSPAYACTMFKNETGTTINQYISAYRVERAKQLLEDPRNKIGDIAAQLGFSDSNYFGKSFKRLVGLSPSEYREKVSE